MYYTVHFDISPNHISIAGTKPLNDSISFARPNPLAAVTAQAEMKLAHVVEKTRSNSS